MTVTDTERTVKADSQSGQSKTFKTLVREERKRREKSKKKTFYFSFFFK